MADPLETQQISTFSSSKKLTRPSLSLDAVPAEFTPGQILAMGALLAGGSKTDAARAAGVDRATVHSWLKRDETFRAFYNSCRKELLDQVQQRQLLLSTVAIRTQERLLKSRKTPAAVKAKIAADILSRMPVGIDGPDTPEAALMKIAEEASAMAKSLNLFCLFLKDDNPEHRKILARLDPDKLQTYWYRVQRGREKADPEIYDLLLKHFGKDEDRS